MFPARLRTRLTLAPLRRAGLLLALALVSLGTKHASATLGPLRASANHRYLVDAQGKPFFVQGEAAWSAIANLSEADATVYLDDVARRGFNAVMVSLIEHKFSARPPANALGVSPFSGVAFQSSPSSAYLDHARWFIREAAKRGIVVFVNPAYLGFQGGDEGWQRDLEAATVASAKAWGAFVGSNLAQETNVVWHLFGDFEPPSHERTNAVQAGLVAGAPSLGLFSQHYERGKSSVEAREPWLGWSYVYPPPVGFMHVEVLSGYNTTPVVPQILGEGYYEGDPQLPKTEDVRRQAWGALTSGAAGHFYGHRYIWGFGNGFEAADWRNALDAPGRKQMSYVESFFRARSWWLLQPDQNDALVVAGRGTKDSAGYVTAALASDRTWAVAYVPGGAGPVTVDRSKLGAKLSVSWLDPRTGKSTLIGTFANSGSQQLKAPDANDWVLVLEQAASTAAPRTVPTSPSSPKKHGAFLFLALAALGSLRRRGGARQALAPDR